MISGVLVGEAASRKCLIVIIARFYTMWGLFLKDRNVFYDPAIPMGLQKDLTVISMALWSASV